MLTIRKTLSSPLFATQPMQALDQSSASQPFWLKTANFAQKTFFIMSKYFLKGVLINATVMAPLSLLTDWAFNIKEEGTLLDMFRKLEPIIKASISPLVAYSIGVIVVPIVEELIFRSLIQNSINKVSRYLLSKNIYLHKKEKDVIYAFKISKLVGSFIFGYAHCSGAGTYSSKNSFVPAVIIG